MSVKNQLSLMWFRRDLRLRNNRALAEACAKHDVVVPVFVFDSTIISKLPKDDRRLTFIYKSIEEIKSMLRANGSDLIVLHGDPKTEIPQIAHLLNAKAVFCNDDYEPAAIARDDHVAKALQEFDCELHRLKDHVIFAKSEILNKSGEPYKVFSAYARVWRSQLTPPDHLDHKANLKHLVPAQKIKKHVRDYKLPDLGFTEQELFIASGEEAAHAQFKLFLKDIDAYNETRDLAYPHRTSLLSPHLRFGTIATRDVVTACLKRRNSEGARVFLNEIIWRDFYQMILFHFPHVVKSCFVKKYDAIKWPGSKAHFDAWCAGQTGYPIVDAAMRQLNQTGWMPNRLRMVVASFLTKDLLINWQWGEHYFAKQLLDFDLAANNGGWQWCASTGTDAQPYFRIFNPESQSKKTDPTGAYIRQYCPELKGVDDKNIHNPRKQTKQMGLLDDVQYPDPIVDHKTQAKKALALFQNIS